MKNKLIFGILTFTILMLISACGKTSLSNEETEDELSVYTTVYPLQYFTERIGKDAVNVQSIYPPGADEHTFDPTQKDMIGLADADLFLYVGLGLEGFVENAEKTMKNEHVKMISVAEAIPKDLLQKVHEDEHDADEHNEDAHDHGEFDPHIWISPKLSIEIASAVKDSLILIAPEKEEEFEKNFQSLHEDLISLDRQYEEMAAEAPRKTFFVSHAAFGYLANTYNLEQIAVAGLNSQSEPSQKQLASLVSYAKAHNVDYVLFEQNVSSKLTKVIQKEIGANALTLHNLGVLTTEDIENNEDYMTLMEKNIETLQQALGNS